MHDDKLKNDDSNWKDKWDNRLWAFWDLADYIRGDRHITPSCVPNGESFKDILLANDQYYKDGFICKQEKDILLEMINEIELFIKSKQESEEYGMINSSKKIILKIENHNWRLITKSTWNTKIWCIYDDLSVEYEIKNGENKTKSYSHKISDEDLKRIIKNIELAKSENREVQAFDGEGWEFIQNENSNVVWERKLGYIYGIEPLENVCDILINLVRNDSDVFIEDEKEENNMGLFGKKDKYDIKPEDNMPQRVYEVPNPQTNEAIDIARMMNYRLHAEQLFVPLLNGFQIENDNNPQTILLASGHGYIEQLTSDGYIDDGQFEQRIDLVIKKTKDFMRSNSCENVDNSFIHYKDYNNGIFNFKLYFQDIIIPVQNGKKVIRNLLAFFVEPKMHDFYQFSLGAGPFTMPTELLKVGMVDLQSDQVTIALDKLMMLLLNNLKYKN